MVVASTAEFVELVRALLDSSQREELAGLVGSITDPKMLAKELMRRSWLTPFQVNQVFQGRARELTLGPYILLERLGQGGMGQVFKARHQVMNRVVALKVIRGERLGNAEAVARFRREIQTTAQLAHPHIVLAHDAGQVGDQHFLVMEFIQGMDLARLIKKMGPLPVAQACDYVRQAALGLQHAHERGLVHRDIKPSNLLVSADGMVKVLDLGLARPLPANVQGEHELTRSGAVVGSPDFLAPEQARDAHVVDIRADIYSLGCTLYFLLAGRAPFPESSLTQKLLWHQHDEPASLTELRADVSAEVVGIVNRMLAKEPAARFQTPAEVAVALTPFCQGSRLPLPAAAPSASSPSSLAPLSHERGWTLAVSSSDEPTPTSTSSTDSRSGASYERGWTLTVPESRMEPTSSSAMTTDHIEPGWKPVVSALPPPAPAPTPARKSQMLRLSRRSWLLATGIGGVALALVAWLIWWPRLDKVNKGSLPVTPVANAKKTNDEKNPNDDIKAGDDKNPKVKSKPSAAEPDPEPEPPVIQTPEPKIVDPTDDPSKPWGEGPVRINFTSKLGVTAKLAGDILTDYSGLGPDHGYGSVFRDFVFRPKRVGGIIGLGRSQTNYLTVLVDQGLMLMIPMDQVKSATAKDKRHVLALRGGKELTGQILSSIKDAETGKTYRLQDARTVVIHQAPAVTPAKPEAARFACVVGALGKRTFGLIQFHLHSNFGRYDNSISIHVAGEEIQANLLDFQSFTITPDEKSFKVRLLTPQGVESTGQYKSFLLFVGEATNSWLLLQFGRSSFASLEVRKSLARKTP